MAAQVLLWLRDVDIARDCGDCAYSQVFQWVLQLGHTETGNISMLEPDLVTSVSIGGL